MSDLHGIPLPLWQIFAERRDPGIGQDNEAREAKIQKERETANISDKMMKDTQRRSEEDMQRRSEGASQRQSEEDMQRRSEEAWRRQSQEASQRQSLRQMKEEWTMAMREDSCEEARRGLLHARAKTLFSTAREVDDYVIRNMRNPSPKS